ncbi:iron chaperone [Nocardioides sp.]|uniref:iron chaperone n=1 Tax=Nocardioides sp. TaxID=35761 RepID=UPI003784E75B
MTTPTDKTGQHTGFTAAERAAMKERAAELKAEGRKGARKADDLEALLAKVAEMPDAERVMAERVHAIVTRVAPQLDPKTWYGMPAWARDGKVVCFFKPGSKFGARYSNLGFNDPAHLDDGDMWPTEYALLRIGADETARIEELVARAAG